MQQNFNTLLQTIHQYKLFPPQTRILLAVSGGADSIALMHWLVHHQSQLQIEVHIATLNHGIRAEATDDLAFVHTMAQVWNIPCYSAERDVPNYAKQHKLSIELAARKVRYQFLAETAHQITVTKIVTAHHADDQSETILMHILRGSGINGLKGMQFTSPMPDYPHLQLIRPLLDTSRLEIERYCAEYHLQARIDQTNFDTTYRRNEIRLDILPRLRKINPQLDDALARLADIAQTEDEYVSQIYQENFKTKAQFAERVTISLDHLQAWHLAMQRRFLVDALNYLQTEPNYEHIQHALSLIEKGQVGAITEFTGDVRMRIGYERINIEPIDLPLPIEDYMQISDEVELLIPSEIIVGDYKLIVSIEPLFDPNALLNIPQGNRIILRTRQNGDKFAPQGMGGHRQKIKKWLIDNKIPRFVRDGLPLLVIENTIGAIILPNAWRIAEAFVKNEISQRIVYFKVIKL